MMDHLTVVEDDHPQKPELKPVAGACLTPLTLVSSVSHGTSNRERPCAWLTGPRKGCGQFTVSRSREAAGHIR